MTETSVRMYPNPFPSEHLCPEEQSPEDLRPERPEDASALLALAARCRGLPHCHWLERLRRSPNFLPGLSLTLWAEETLLAQAMLVRLPLCVHRQRLHTLVAAPVLAHPHAPPGAGARLLAQAMRQAADIGYALVALPLEPSYHRHAGFVPQRAEEWQERTPFAAGVPFVLKGLGQEHEALAQNLAPHLIIYPCGVLAVSSPWSIMAAIAEQRIQEAQDQGAFDHLPGAGKPLDMEDDSHVPEDLRMVYKLLRNAGYLPPELEERKEITSLVEMLEKCSDEGLKVRQMQKLK